MGRSIFYEEQTTTSIIHALNYHIQNFGCPDEIHSAAGCRFRSQMFKDYCNFLDSNDRISSVLYPASNGLAENAVKLVKTALPAKLDCSN